MLSFQLMINMIYGVIPMIVFLCCGNTYTSMESSDTNWIDTTGTTISKRILTPSGFIRNNAIDGSFANYLQNLQLKSAEYPIHLFNGSVKSNQTNRIAVVDMAISKKDLQQCADACIRLRAEYLWKQKKYDQISFHLTNGFEMEYSKWRDGMRLIVNGNSTKWEKKKSIDTSYETFLKYLETVFTYAGTISLYRELETISPENLVPGDVIIEAGSPGHAIMVADMIVDANGNKKILLMQSYMPAQEIHILATPSEDNGNPWYSIPNGGNFRTADWTFEDYKVGRFIE